MKTLPVRIPDELRAALEERAEADGRPVTSYVRYVLQLMVDNDITPQDLREAAEGEDR